MKFLSCMLFSMILFVIITKASDISDPDIKACDSSDTDTDSSEGRSGKYKNYLQRKWNLPDIKIQNSLDDLVDKDCQTLYQSGNSKSIRDVYQTMTLVQAESKKRKLNDGFLPLNPPTQDEMVKLICTHFTYQEHAVDFFEKYKNRQILHPVSSEKILNRIKKHYVSKCDLPKLDEDLEEKTTSVKQMVKKSILMLQHPSFLELTDTPLVDYCPAIPRPLK